jgi:choline kinase
MRDNGRARGQVRAVILAAGRGSRLGALAESTPKWLLEVGGTTIAERQLAALGDSLRSNGSEAAATALVVTGHAREAIESFLRTRADSPVRVLHNPEYARLNNWYSLLVALRELRCGDHDRLVVLNADLFAEPEWIAEFIEASATTSAESLIAVDVERELTDESMKVAARQGPGEGAQLLHAIGKVGVDDPVGEYVGMLMARGSVLDALTRTLEGFVDRDDSVNEWYERAVGITAQQGSPWHVWATPSSAWVEIDDDGDYESARDLCAG